VRPLKNVNFIIYLCLASIFDMSSISTESQSSHFKDFDIPILTPREGTSN